MAHRLESAERRQRWRKYHQTKDLDDLPKFRLPTHYREKNKVPSFERRDESTVDLIAAVALLEAREKANPLSWHAFVALVAAEDAQLWRRLLHELSLWVAGACGFAAVERLAVDAAVMAGEDIHHSEFPVLLRAAELQRCRRAVHARAAR